MDKAQIASHMSRNSEQAKWRVEDLNPVSECEYPARSN
jgi:hypothetical protein